MSKYSFVFTALIIGLVMMLKNEISMWEWLILWGVISIDFKLIEICKNFKNK